jgi:hypothetical protein
MPKPQKKFFICGSRYPTGLMTDVARWWAVHIWYRHHQILVGDAVGIDSDAIEKAEQWGTAYTAYGVWDKPRNNAKNYCNVYDLVRQRLATVSNPTPSQLYTERDRWLVEQADFVVCIWNGVSKNTLAVYEYAQQLGIEAQLCEPKPKMMGYSALAGIER